MLLVLSYQLCKKAQFILYKEGWGGGADQSKGLFYIVVGVGVILPHPVSISQ